MIRFLLTCLFCLILPSNARANPFFAFDNIAVKGLREAGEKLFVVSINGADAGLGRAGGWDRLIRPLGEGTFDVGVVLRELKALGFAGPVGFQGYAIAGERYEILEKTIGAWRELNGKP